MKVRMTLWDGKKTIAEFNLDAENLIALAVYQEALGKLTAGTWTETPAVTNPEDLRL